MITSMVLLHCLLESFLVFWETWKRINNEVQDMENEFICKNCVFLKWQWKITWWKRKEDENKNKGWKEEKTERVKKIRVHAWKWFFFLLLLLCRDEPHLFGASSLPFGDISLVEAEREKNVKEWVARLRMHERFQKMEMQ